MKKELNNSGLNYIAFKKRLSIFLLLGMCFVVYGSMSFANETSERTAQKGEVTVYRNAQVDKLKNTDRVELTEVHIIGAYWQRDPRIPKGPILKNLHFFVTVREWLKEQNIQQLYDFSARAAKEMTLKSKGHPDIRAAITKGTIAMSDIRGYWFTINEEDLDKMVPNIPYTIHIDNISAVYRWIVEGGVTLTRLKDK